MFEGVYQFEVNFESGRGKLPIFYRKASTSISMFPAKTKEAEKLIPQKIKRLMKVGELIPGITVLGLAGFKYEDTDIGQYNEVAVTLPLTEKSTLSRNFGLTRFILSLIRGDFKVHIRHLPVTTEIAREAGVVIYNYPKFVAKIDFEDDGKNFSLTKDKEKIFSLEVKRMFKTSIKKKFLFTTFQQKDEAVIKAEVLAEGEDIEIGFFSSEINLNINTEIGKELCSLLMSRRSLVSMFIPKMRAILHLPVKIA
jgi:hypothetical protein